MYKELRDFALELVAQHKDVTKPFGQFEVLLLYSLAAGKLRSFLKAKELAAKVWLPDMQVLKRGSKQEPLFVDELADNVTIKMLEARANGKAGEPTAAQKKVGGYFVPRKLADFFYATNGEGAGRSIDRIFFDIDRGEGASAEQAQDVAKELCDALADSRELAAALGEKARPFACWTGASFHVHLMLRKQQPHSFYEENFAVGKAAGETLANGIVLDVAKGSGAKVVGGHGKIKGAITIDPSQTPSGKLCRSPLGSLHMRDASTIDGVSLPLTLKMLGENGLTGELQSYTPERVIEELDSLAKRLPC
jgi:hypothetical protein